MCSNDQENIEQIMFDYKSAPMGSKLRKTVWKRKDQREKAVWVLVFCEHCQLNGHR